MISVDEVELKPQRVLQLQLESATACSTIRLSPEADSRLTFLATTTGRTKTFYLREIVERGLDDMEDYYLTADVLENVRKGREAVHTSQDVRRALSLDN